MATQYVHRIILIVPVARVSVLVTWFKANIGPNSIDDNLGPGLNATGSQSDPITHRWCCGSYTDNETKAIIIKLCQLSSVVPPTNNQWGSWSKAEKRTWLSSVQDSIKLTFGILVLLADNNGRWDTPEEALNLITLKVIRNSTV